MLSPTLSERLASESNRGNASKSTDCKACCHPSSLNHGRARIRFAIIGGIFILNSGLAKWFFYKENPMAEKVSAVLGALIVSTPIVVAAIKDVIKGKFYMNELVALALLSGFVAGNYQEVGIIAFFMLIAIAIEERTASGAQASIEELIKLTPDRARVVDPETGNDRKISLNGLKVNDVIRVRPGEAFPADGIIITGTSTVSEASITGESLPVDKTKNAQVYAGTQNLTGMVEARVTAVGKKSTLGKVRELIESAEKTRFPVMRMIDDYAVYYTPVILMIGGVLWFFTQDLMRLVLILVIACPCALIVATPSAVIAAIAAAARKGILIKNAAHIETTAQIDTVVFDKTGTLTTGNLEVARLSPVEGVELSELLQAAVTAESQSNHPTAQAMKNLARQSNVNWDNPHRFTEYAGKGVVVEVNGDTLRVGRENWLHELGVAMNNGAETKNGDNPSREMSVVHISKNGKLLGWIGFRDSIRKSAKHVVHELSALGITQCSMITGDNGTVANSVASQLGIDEVKADCFPETKVEYVKKLKGSSAMVAVVGDGVNDAPALATGDIGIAMGVLGSDIAINSASIALMNNDLTKVPFLIALSRKTRCIINMNIIFSGLMILGGLIFFILGDQVISQLANLVHVQSSIFKSFLAAGIHISGTLAVFFNSARLLRYGESTNL